MKMFKNQSREKEWEMMAKVQLFGDILPRYPEAALIDIGAHMGMYTVSAAKLGRRVFAFEPNMEEKIPTLI